METNRQMLDRLGITKDEYMLNYAIEHTDLCSLCNEMINKNLSPSNPVCEGRWCIEAMEIWLDEEAEQKG